MGTDRTAEKSLDRLEVLMVITPPKKKRSLWTAPHFPGFPDEPRQEKYDSSKSASCR